jgi:hypothetical protein
VITFPVLLLWDFLKQMNVRVYSDPYCNEWNREFCCPAVQTCSPMNWLVDAGVCQACECLAAVAVVLESRLRCCLYCKCSQRRPVICEAAEIKRVDILNCSYLSNITTELLAVTLQLLSSKWYLVHAYNLLFIQNAIFQVQMFHYVSLSKWKVKETFFTASVFFYSITSP